VSGFWAFSGFCPKMATSDRRMQSEAASLKFIGSRECTGAGATKKAAPFGATLFKEAKWRESEETEFDAAPGDRNGQSEMSRTARVKLFQRMRPLHLSWK